MHYFSKFRNVGLVLVLVFLRGFFQLVIWRETWLFYYPREHSAVIIPLPAEIKLHLLFTFVHRSWFKVEISILIYLLFINTHIQTVLKLPFNPCPVKQLYWAFEVSQISSGPCHFNYTFFWSPQFFKPLFSKMGTRIELSVGTIPAWFSK